MIYYPTAEEAGIIDRYTIEEIGVPQMVLMERAALHVADAVGNLIEHESAAGFKDRLNKDIVNKDIVNKDKRIVAIAESGNNGGDAVAAARILKLKGFDVDIIHIDGISKRSEAFTYQLNLSKKAGIRIISLKDEINLRDELINKYDYLIDGIFGVGLSREVKGIHKDVIELMNKTKGKVISVDVPSGVSSDTGEILGAAVKADVTVTFGYIKKGLLFNPAQSLAGHIILGDIGFYPDKNSEILHYTYDRNDVKNRLPVRRNDSNKGTYGKVLIVAGSENISGAAFLAGNAAYRTGTGLVKVFTHENNRKALETMLPEALLYFYRDFDSEAKKELESSLDWASCAVVGPGLSLDSNARYIMDTLLNRKKNPGLILDADAINIISESKEKKELLKEVAKKTDVILTPHLMEMARFIADGDEDLKEKISYIKNNRSKVAINAAKDYHIILVLKDARTFVTDPDSEKIYINTTGNSGMSTGGSGDTLTGIIAGLIAGGVDCDNAARLGVYLHGAAGDIAKEKLGEHSVMARDIADNMGQVIKEISEGR